jgi:hypothetical protein
METDGQQVADLRLQAVTEHESIAFGNPFASCAGRQSSSVPGTVRDSDGE